jgi:soluble lytic murein transglycosylase-like protein
MTSCTYETDFLHWTQEQSAALRAGQSAALDWEHIAEALEDMGREQQLALQSLLRQILVHLLKLQLSPPWTPRAKWIEEIIEFRDQAQARIEATPSLARYAPELFSKAWQQARRAAERAFALYGEPVQVPVVCPYSVDQALDPDFFPER